MCLDLSLGFSPHQLYSTTAIYLSSLLHLPNLHHHLNLILCSTVACFLIQFSSHYLISPTLFPLHYPNLSRFTRFNWDTHVVAWLHSFYAVSIALWVLFNPIRYVEIHQDKVFGYNLVVMHFLAISAGYFLWDIFVSSILLWNGHGVGFLVHASCCFIAYIYTIKPFVAYYGFIFLLWESSTVFLNPHWFFDKIGMTGSKAQLYNGVALITSFFFSRLVLGNWASYQIFVHSIDPHVRDKVGRKTLSTILCLDVSLSVLNVYWFYQMVASVRKRRSSVLIDKPRAQLHQDQDKLKRN